MSTLFGTKIKDTYDGLLKVSDNVGITSTKKIITDGLGNDSSVYISSEDFQISTFFYVDINSGTPASSKIGLGTSSPTTTLHIVGDLRLTARFYDSNNSTGTSNQVLSSTGSGTDWVTLSEIGGVDGTGVANKLAYWLDTETITYDNLLHWDSSNNRLGVGTATPQTKLEVNGSFRVSSGNEKYLDIDDGGYVYKIGDIDGGEGNSYLEIDSNNSETNLYKSTLGIPTYIFHQGNTTTKFGFSTTDTFVVRTNDVERFSVNNSGVALAGGSRVTTILDEDDMASDSNTSLATQQSIKAFVESEIASVPSGLNFQGNWNADTNSPTLASGTGTVGHFYNVSTPGSTDLDGETDWKIGDWAVFVEAGGTDKWMKIDNTSVLSGVGSANKIAYWSNDSTLTYDTDFYVDGDTIFTTNLEASGTAVAGSVRTPTITTGSGASLFLKPNASGHIYLGDSANGTNLYHYSASDDGKYTTYDFNGNYYRISTTATSGVWINDPLIIGGDTEVQNSQLKVRDTSSNKQIRIQASVGGNARIQTHDTNTGTDQNVDIEALQINLKTGSISGSTNVSTLLLDSSNNATFGGDISNASGHFTISSADDFNVDATGQINLDADGGNIRFKDGGTHYGTLRQDSSHFIIEASTADKDIILRGTDDTTEIDALRLDMSNGGNATFVGEVTSKGLKLTENTTLYPSDASISYHSSTNAVYVNGAGNDGWLRLNASGVSNDVNAINIFGTNQGSFQTFKTGGSTRMFINSSGQIGIGTTSPGAKLHIVQTSYPAFKAERNGGTTATQGYTQIGHTEIGYSGGTGADSYIISKYGFGFVVNESSKILVLTDSGKVGIGTDDPSEKLSVSGGNIAVANGSSIMIGGSIGDTKIGKLYNVSGVLSLDGDGTRNIRLGSTTNGEVVRIDNTNGRVGIGTTSPSYKLDVDGEIKSDGYRIDLSATTQRAIASTGTDSIQFGDAGVNNLKFKNASGVALDIASNGNATFTGNITAGDDGSVIGGDGVVSLYARSTGTVSYVQIQNSTTGSNTTSDGLTLGVNGSTAYVWQRENASLHLGTNDSSALTINSSQNVGIGTTSPGTNLDIVGVGAQSLRVKSDSSATIIIDSDGDNDGTAGSYLHYRDTGATKWTLYKETNNDFYLYNASATTYPIHAKAGGDIVLMEDGNNLGVGVSSPSEKLDVAGNIKLSGNAILQGDAGNAQKYLAIYNEGTNTHDDALISFKTHGSRQYSFGIDRSTTNLAITSGYASMSAGDVLLEIDTAGKFTLPSYGSGTYTGTATQRLAVDSSGNIIELPIGSGAVDGSGVANRLAIWSDTDTLTSNVNIVVDSGELQLGNGLLVEDNDTSVITAKAYEPHIIWQKTRGSGGDDYFKIKHENDASAVDFSLAQNGGSDVRIMRINNNNRVIVGGYNEYNASTLNVEGTFGVSTTSKFGGNAIFVSDVGIGETSIDAKLHISDGATANIKFERPGHSKWAFGIPDGQTYLAFDETNDGLTTPTMVLTKTTKRVGIGTTSPGAPLHVVGNAYVQSGTFYTNGITSYSGTTLNLNAGSSHFNLTVNSAERMRIDSSGQVGIGTTSPKHKLYVSGDIGQTDGSRIWFRGSDSSSATGAQSYVYSNGLNLQIKGDDNVQLLGDGGSVILHADYSGKVGINNTSPSTTLDVSGDATISGTITSGNITTNSRITFDYNGSGTGNNYLESGTDTWAFKNSGGTTAFLIDHSDQSVDITGALNMGAGQKIYLGGSDSRMHIYHTGSGGEATVLTKEGNLNLVNQSHGDDIVFKTENSSGTVVTPLTLDSGGDATFVGNITTTGSSITIDPPSGDAVLNLTHSSQSLRIDQNSIRTTTNSHFSLMTNHTTALYIDTSQNIGIGTTSPLTQLHLSNTNGGAIYIEDSDSTNTYNITSISNGGGNLSFDTRNSTGGFVSTDYQMVKDSSGANYQRWFTQGNERMRITSTGKLGIGTTAPSQMLHVLGGDENTMKLDASTGQPALFFAQSGANRWEMRADSSHYGLYSYGTSTWEFYILNGNTGIGTNSPSKKLDVEGNIRAITTGGATASEIDITSGATWRLRSNPTSGDNLYGLDIIKGSAGTDIKMQFDLNGNATFAGSVTTSSYVKSAIGFRMASGQAIDFIDTNIGYNSIERNTSVGGLQINTGDSASINILDNGLVGIGTTSPGGKLEIKSSSGSSVVIDGRASGSYAHSNIYLKSGDSSGSWNAYRLKYVKDGSNDRLEFIDGSGNPNIYFVNGGAATFAGSVDATNYKINGAQGSDGQVLTSTGSGVAWETPSGGGGGTIDGSGTANYITKWTDSDTIGDSIISSSGTNVTIATNNDYPILQLLRDGDNPSTNQLLGRIQFMADYGGSHQNWGRIELDTNASATRTDMDFYVKSTGGSELLTMKLNGTAAAGGNVIVYNKLGIGTTSPDYLLDVSSGASNDAYIQVRNADDSAGAYFKARSGFDGYYGIEFFDKTTAKWYIGGYGSNRLGFWVGSKTTASNEKMSFTTDGRLGIGTTTPSSLLHLESASSPTLQITDTTNTVTFKAYSQDSNSHIGTITNHSLIIDTNNTAAITIDTSQNATFAGSVHLDNDSAQLQLGDDNDMQIYSNGANGVIDNNTGDLIIRCDSDDIKILAEDDVVIRDNDDSTEMAKFINGGAVELYHNGNKKIETTSTGVEATGYYDFASTGSGYGFKYGVSPGTTQGIAIKTSDTGGAYFDGVGYFWNENTGNGANMFQMQNDGDTYCRYINFFRGGNTSDDIIGWIGYNATNTATTYSTSSSDERLKKNIVDWDEEVLPKFLALEPKQFHFNKQDDSEEKNKGYIAQQEVDNFPEVYQLNGEGDDARYGFHPMEMTPYLMKAIKELVEKNKELEARLEALEK